VGASALGRAELPLAGHLDSLTQEPGLQRVELTERHGGAALRLPVDLPIYRTHAVEAAPRLDGEGADWPMDAQLKVYGEMKAGIRYLSRPDLMTASVRQDGGPAVIRWSYDQENLYFWARCPQERVSDERNTTWPMENGRWWGSDGLQVQVAAMERAGDATRTLSAMVEAGRVVQIAFKPAGVMLVRTGRVVKGADGVSRMEWTEGGPAAGGVKYGIAVEKKEGRVTGYAVEAAIPRSWVSGKIEGVRAPAWRVNVLRHRAGDLASMSWSGPVVNDEDVGMMGLVVGE
jgi:hypothetical protein